MSIFLAICLGICLSAACGFRVFVPFLVAGVAVKCGFLDLKAGWSWIGSWPAIVAFSTATIVEIIAFKFPVVDNALDSIATPSAAVAGTLMTVAIMPADVSTLYTWAIGIIGGGGAATSVQLTTVGARALSTLSTGGIANPILSLLEDVGAFIVSVLAICIPAIIFAFLVIAVICASLFISRNKGKAA